MSCRFIGKTNFSRLVCVVLFNNNQILCLNSKIDMDDSNSEYNRSITKNDINSKKQTQELNDE